MRALANRALGAAWQLEQGYPAANDELDVGLIDLKILRKLMAGAVALTIK